MLVTRFGMSDKIGMLSLQQSDSMKGYSEEVGEAIDEEIVKIVSECTERTKLLVAEHADKISALADRLI